MTRPLFQTLLFTACSISLAAQAGKPPRFEVASIRPIQGQQNFNVKLTIEHGMLHVDNANLRQIVGQAYSLPAIRVEGGPSWAGSDLFRIEAKAGNPNATRAQVKAMLQTLLADRFHLAARHETKELPVYILGLEKNGPKLRKAKEGDSTSAVLGEPDSGQTGGRPLDFRHITLTAFANTVGNILRTPVLDQTGLQGFYDIHLELYPQTEATEALMEAVQDQLGFKLEPAKRPLEVLVVDRAEKPGAN
jgi:uncharacterized protein (TIGR03435 family)